LVEEIDLTLSRSELKEKLKAFWLFYPQTQGSVQGIGNNSGRFDHWPEPEGDSFDHRTEVDPTYRNLQYFLFESY